MSYSPSMIARYKALMRAGIGPKLLASLSNVSFHTLKDWDDEQRQAHIEPDEQAVEELKALLAR